MQTFSALPMAETGALFSNDLEKQARSFVEKHPFLKADSDYIEFLIEYGGASVDLSFEHFFTDVHGFASRICTTFEDLQQEWPLISEEGFFSFATQARAGGVESFAFDATGRRRRGVYASWMAFEGYKVDPFAWRYESFVGWLGHVLETYQRAVPQEGQPMIAGVDKAARWAKRFFEQHLSSLPDLTAIERSNALGLSASLLVDSEANRNVLSQNQRHFLLRSGVLDTAVSNRVMHDVYVVASNTEKSVSVNLYSEEAARTFLQPMTSAQGRFFSVVILAATGQMCTSWA